MGDAARREDRSKVVEILTREGWEPSRIVRATRIPRATVYKDLRGLDLADLPEWHHGDQAKAGR
jgi:transcriptional regulator of acetoin/glycerol metabolism